MPLVHTVSDDGMVITYLRNPVQFDDLVSAMEILARYARPDVKWHQLLVVEANAIADVNFVDLLTVSDWLSEIGEGFEHLSLSVFAETEADYQTAYHLAELTSSERVSLAVFQNLSAA